MPSEDGFDAAWGDESDWSECAFDEAFVDAAVLTEPSAEERTRRAVRARRELELDTRLAAQRSDTWTSAESDDFDPHQMAGNSRWIRRAIGMLVVAALVLSFVVLSTESASREVASGSAVGLSDDQTSVEFSKLEARPTRTTSSGVRLAKPAPTPAGKGGFRFLATEPGAATPVTYDPCREIHYVVNTENAPVGADQVLRSAISTISHDTGLVFSDDGVSSETPGKDRSPFQPGRYGDRWAPVIIWWTSPQRAPKLAGDVAGYAGSLMIESSEPPLPSLRTYVTGEVVLDGPQLSGVWRQPDGQDLVRAVILHELGHLVGLDHVDDPSQLMYPRAERSLTNFANGDLRGLHQLGLGRCVASL